MTVDNERDQWLRIIDDQANGPYPDAVIQLATDDESDLRTRTIAEAISELQQLTIDELRNRIMQANIRSMSDGITARTLSQNFREYHTLTGQRIATATYRGARKTQEDRVGISYGINPNGNPYTLTMLTDGIASEKQGNLAAEIIVQSWIDNPHWGKNFLKPDVERSLLLVDTIQNSGACVAGAYLEQQENGSSTFYPYYSGDSRIEVYTPDHSLMYGSTVQNVAHTDLARGKCNQVEFIQHEMRNVIHRSVKWNEDGRLIFDINKPLGLATEDKGGISEAIPRTLLPGSTVLLGSDGLTECMPLSEVYEVYRSNPGSLRKVFRIVSGIVHQRKKMFVQGCFKPDRLFMRFLKKEGRLPKPYTTIPTDDNCSLIIMST